VEVVESDLAREEIIKREASEEAEKFRIAQAVFQAQVRKNIVNTHLADRLS
jgi:hypothetical protein